MTENHDIPAGKKGRPAEMRLGHDNRIIGWLAVATGLIMVLRQVELIEIPLPLSLLPGLLSVIFAIRADRKIGCYKSLLLFWTVMLATLLIHIHPGASIRLQRYIAFTIGLVIFSPLIYSDTLTLLREKILKTILITVGIATIISALVYLWVGIIGEIGHLANIDYYFYGFKGIFRYGMVLSPVAAIAAISALYHILFGRISTRITMIFYSVVLILGIGMCVAAGSRISLAGMILSMVYLIIRFRTVLRSFFSSLRGKVIFTVSLIILVFIILNSLPTLIDKTQNSQANGSIFFSRLELWEARINEFKTSPLTGIGYANELPHESEPIPDLTQLEPGSSWLMIATYGGLLGIAAMIFLLISYIRNFSRRNIIEDKQKSYQVSDQASDRISDRALYVALLIFTLINSLMEGWLMFTGAALFPVFWISVSLLYRHKSITD